MSKKKRYVLIGTGGRGLGMFAQPLLTDFTRTAELVGLFDHNQLRLHAANQLLKTTLPTFTDFKQMLDELDPDGIIVCTQDSTHAAYVVAGLEAGKRVYCEKPLCTTAAQCQQIMAAASSSKGEAFVTHNMRYGAAMLAIKEQIDSGKIGDLLSLEFRDNLDRSHGADYFRRWHRFKENSGGLLIHKASHHFDLMNWLVGSKAKDLSARGGTLFYGANGTLRGTHCRGCDHRQACDFHIDLESDERARLLYISAEEEDHYLRDGCVFDERIDTEDYATTTYSYENGVQVNYSLCAYASYEGIFLAVEGSEGRLEYDSVQSTSWAVGNRIVPGMDEAVGSRLSYIHPRHGRETIEVAEGKGGHGGSDPALRQEFFAQPWQTENTAQMATLAEAIQAVLIGVAANESMARGSAPIEVQSLLA